MKIWATWLMGLAHERPQNPEFPYPREYRNAADFFVAALYQQKDPDQLVRIGDAAGVAFHRFLNSGGYVPEALERDAAEVASNLLFLIEALPSGQHQSRELVKTLITMLCSPGFRAFPNPHVDLHKRLLLALPGKLDVGKCHEPEVPTRLREDLYDRDYASAACSVCVRLSPLNAARALRTALKTLREHDRPTAQMFADFIIAIPKHPIDVKGTFITLADFASDREKETFRTELAALGSGDLLMAWDEICLQSAIPPADNSKKWEAVFPGLVKQFLSERQRNPLFDLTGESSWKALAAEFGDLLGDEELKRWRDAGKPRDELVDSARLQAFVTALDNGWTRTLISDWESEIVQVFNDSRRRLFVARAVRECIRRIASSVWWEMPREEFEQEIGDLNLNQYLTPIAALLPEQSSHEKRLKVAVSPFPEDQLFFLVLEAAGKLNQRVIFEPMRISWADHNSVDADCCLLNELAIGGAISYELTLANEIFLHEGYFVFADRKPASNNLPIDRLRFAFANGFSRYTRGEYPKIAEKLKDKAGAVSGQAFSRAESWPRDFESFITGKSRFYIGGSINSRLLLRLWMRTGRVFEVCQPSDFAVALGRMPANRLVLGPAFIQHLRQGVEPEVRKQLVGLYRTVGGFLHRTARAAMDGNEAKQKLIRHFMHYLARASDQHEDGFWNFVVSEEDMCSLICEDNRFVLDDSILATASPIPMIQ